ncbi:MAG: hypothetical protein ACKOOF_00875 [Planctomycetaceae bacterium]
MPLPNVSCPRNNAPFRGPSWVLLCLALVCLTASAVAAGPSKPRGPIRFFESLVPKQPEPAFIQAPSPPTEADVPELERLAAVPKPTAAKPAVTKPAAIKPTVARPSAIKSAPVSTTPARLPTWSEAVAFGSSLREVAVIVAADAADHSYVPKPPVPKLPPATVTVTPKKTLPIVATRLQATGAPPPRSTRFERLRVRIAQTLATYQRRPLNTAHNTPWEVMHGFIAFGIPTQVRVGGPAGDLVNAIGWSNMGGRCRGQVMLAASGDRLTALKGFGVQGHSAQYLAILAQCRVAANSPIAVNGKNFTVTDLIEEEKLSCKSMTELTFALIALAHYLPTDAEWKSRDGKDWSLERLVEEEIVQPIRGAPCGGTHRLFGLAYGCQRRLRATGQLDGAYLRADKYVRDYQQFALTKLQNRDGSFSTEWFKYLADREDDIDRKIQTTGHILEWLVSSLDQERLYDNRVVAAAEFLSAALAREPSREWKIGPLGHALHALNIYQERAWGVVLPGGIAAYSGSMKAADKPLIADRPEPADKTPARR